MYYVLIGRNNENYIVARQKTLKGAQSVSVPFLKLIQARGLDTYVCVVTPEGKHLYQSLSLE